MVGNLWDEAVDDLVDQTSQRLGGVLGPDGGAAADAGYQITLEEQESHTAVALTEEEMANAQATITEAVDFVVANNPDLSGKELEDKIHEHVKSLNLPQQLGTDQIHDMTQFAMTRTDTGIADNAINAQTEVELAMQEEQTGLGALFASLKEWLAPIMSIFAGIEEETGIVMQAEEFDIANLGNISPPAIGDMTREQSLGIA